MLDRRRARPFLVAVAALAVLGPTLPASAAHADPSPTPAQVRAAQAQVTAAQESFSNVQVQAEQAAEQYNGALSRATAAEQVATQATRRAQTADVVEAQAQGVATGAQAASDAAQIKATQAKVAQQQAEAQVTQSQLDLNRMAAAAYTGGGQLSDYSALFTSTDPSSFAHGQVYVDRIGNYQQNVIVTLNKARDKATVAAQASAIALTAAGAASAKAQAALATATAASDKAGAARSVALQAVADSHHALFLASKAKGHALYLVAKAEKSLGSAKQRAHHLELAAEAARAAAVHVVTGKVPSNAAAIAIHWAFQEIGVPYSWGGGDANGPTYGFAQGSGTRGFDCSGLTLFAYAHANISLDHYTGSQWDEGKRISSRADLEPGDLMFFAYDTSDPSTIHHVALYIGNDQMIEAPYTGSVVRVSNADRSDFIGATRPWA